MNATTEWRGLWIFKPQSGDWFKHIEANVARVERRPHYRDRTQHTEQSSPSSCTVPGIGGWSLRWRDRDGEWHRYDGFENVPQFRDVLREVDADPTGIFLGEVANGGDMPLPSNLDEDKLSEVALALLGLTAFTSHRITRAWKGLDWDLLDLLFRKGWIADPVGKAKSVVLTEAGERLAPELLIRHFGTPPADRGRAV